MYESARDEKVAFSKEVVILNEGGKENIH